MPGRNQSPRVRRASFVVLGVAIVATAISCRDNLLTDRVAESAGADQQRVAAAGGRAADMHRRNPMDRVGRLHNQFMEEVRLEMRRTNKMPKNVCARGAAFVERNMDAGGLDAEVRRGLHAVVRARCEARSPALKRSRAKHAAFMLEDYEVSEVYLAAAQTIDSIAEITTGAEDFATRAAGLLSSTSSMREIDAAAVQALIAVAQSSLEYWISGDVLNEFISQASSDFDMCDAGRADGETYQVGPDETVECREGRIVSEASFRAPAVRSGFSYASNMASAPFGRPNFTYTASPTPTPFICANAWTRFKRVWNWDRTGATDGALIGMGVGALAGSVAGGVGAVPGAVAGGAIGALDGAQRTSSGAAIWEAYGYVQCSRSL